MRMQTIDMQTQVVVQDLDSGERHITTFSGLVQDNGWEHMLPVIAAVSRGERFMVGGGAAPLFEISRLLQ